MANEKEPVRPKFQNLTEGYEEFRQRALSDFTPKAILNVAEGSFYAGAQTTLCLIQEGLNKIEEPEFEGNPEEHGRNLLLRLHSEVLAFFAIARMKK